MNYYSIITADVIGSRRVASFPRTRDRKLKEISSLHAQRNLILSPYTVTAWDEFEVIIAKPEFTPFVILDLRRMFYPLELRIAVGIGSAQGVRKKPINLHAGGQAFERARSAAEKLKAGNPKYRLLTLFDSGNQLFDSIANTIYTLHDSLMQRTTASQWAAINTILETGRQDRAAKRLKLDISTVSRNLKRGSYWQLIETADTMEQVVKAYF